MMVTEHCYSAFEVSADEKLARIILYPRDIDAITGLPKESFITLRSGESGISFLRFDYMGEEAFRKSGETRASFYNKGLKKTQVFVRRMDGGNCK